MPSSNKKNFTEYNYCIQSGSLQLSNHNYHENRINILQCMDIEHINKTETPLPTTKIFTCTFNKFTTSATQMYLRHIRPVYVNHFMTDVHDTGKLCSI